MCPGMPKNWRRKRIKKEVAHAEALLRGGASEQRKIVLDSSIAVKKEQELMKNEGKVVEILKEVAKNDSVEK